MFISHSIARKLRTALLNQHPSILRLPSGLAIVYSTSYPVTWKRFIPYCKLDVSHFLLTTIMSPPAEVVDEAPRDPKEF